MSEVVQFGHRELWVVKDTDWSLPIFCDPYTNNGFSVTHWAVRAAVELLATPFRELSTRFSPFNLGSETKFWIVTDQQLRKTASKASGCMPKDYLKWTSDVPGKETTGRELINDNYKDEEFLRFVCERSGMDLPLGRFMWRAIKDHMLFWFKNVQKPINFELFTIHPMPYRANWKEIMLSKHSDSPHIFRKKKSFWRASLISTGFMEDLGSTDLMAMNRNRTFSWNLEIEMHKLLINELADGERQRIVAKRPSRYAKYYESSIRKRLTDIIDVYAAWLKQVEQPVGSIHESVLGSDPVLMPASKRRKVLPSWHRPGTVTYQPASHVPQLKQGHRVPRRMGKKIKEMLELPHIQPVIEDVRNSNKQTALDGPTDRGNGNRGLSLLHATQGQTGGGRLLAAGEETES